MSVTEVMLRIFAQIEPVTPFVLVVALATLIALPILLLISRNLWVRNRRFHWMSLFFGLSGGDCLRLACAWIKFLLLVSFLVAFRKMSVFHYLLFLIPGVLYALSPREWARIPGRLFWLVLEGVGLLACNLICGYVRDMDTGWLFMAVYVLMSLFVGLFACYLFLTEINDISAGRRIDLKEEWEPGGNDSHE